MTTAARKLIAVDEIHTTTAGQYVLSSQLTVDSGVTITLWDGYDTTTAHRFTYWNREIARSRYAQIRDLARNGRSAEQIQQRINWLDSAAYLAAGSSIADTNALVALERAAEQYETPAERAERAEIAARLNADLDARAAQAEQVADPAVDYLAQLTDQRHTAITNAVAAAGSLTNLRNSYAAAAGTTPRNRVTLAPGTNRALSDAMWRMLDTANQRGGTIRLDSRDLRNRASAIQKRSNYLNLIYATDGVPSSLYLAEITDPGRKALAQQQTKKAVA